MILQDLLVTLVLIGYAVGVLLTFGTVLTWVERKQAAVMADRIGANRAYVRIPFTQVKLVWLGLFHGMADGLKMMLKEDFRPKTYDALGYALGPWVTFVPVLLTRQGMSVGEAGTAMALYLFMSGVGGFWGGRLSDRLGPRRVIVWSLLLATPFLLLAPQTQGWTFALLLALGGLFLQSTLPVNVSFGQALAPHSAATVSSLIWAWPGDRAACSSRSRACPPTRWACRPR